MQNIRSSFDDSKYTPKMDINMLFTTQTNKSEKNSQSIEASSNSLCSDNDSFENITLESDQNEKNKQGQNMSNKKGETSLYKKSNTIDLIQESQEQHKGQESTNQRKILNLHKCENHYNEKIDRKTRYSIDSLGIDSARLMDPESYREMLKYKQEKMRMRALLQMKSLVTKKLLIQI
jgi:hypothetical protein